MKAAVKVHSVMAGTKGVLNMPKFYMLIGPAGCGKTYLTWKFLEEGFKDDEEPVLVSSDLVRKELYGDESVQKDHAKVFEICHARIESAFRGGHGLVIFDATNLNAGHRMAAIKAAKRGGCDYVYGFVYTGSLETCLARNAARERKVPEDAIANMYKLLWKHPPTLAEGFDFLVSTAVWGKGRS